MFKIPYCEKHTQPESCSGNTVQIGNNVVSPFCKTLHCTLVCVTELPYVSCVLLEIINKNDWKRKMAPLSLCLEINGSPFCGIVYIFFKFTHCKKLCNNTLL